jgi:hypothetical protein
MTPGQDPGPPPDHVTAETYLRLRAEAELRRVEALPRPDPLAAIGIPAPLRGAVRLGLPLGQRAITALEPLAGNAAQTLQPLAESAARTARPLADDAARTLQPLANAAVQALQPLTNRLAGAVLPAAEQMARRLNPWSGARPARRVSSARQVELVGGGGTDMGAGIEAAGRLRPRPSITVVLTDGFTPWPDRPPRGMRVVVGLLGDDAPDAPDWARTVRVPAS